VFAPSVGTLIVKEQDGFAETECDTASLATVAGETLHPETVKVPLGDPLGLTEIVIGCVTVLGTYVSEEPGQLPEEHVVTLLDVEPVELHL
jgi:hypothetical protein